MNKVNELCNDIDVREIENCTTINELYTVRNKIIDKTDDRELLEALLVTIDNKRDELKK